jgi:hypothetical protein
MENGPQKWLPDGWTLFRGFGGLSLANWGEIGQKLKRLISLFYQMQGKGVLTNWCWYVEDYFWPIDFKSQITRIMKYKGMKNKGQYSKRGKK